MNFKKIFTSDFFFTIDIAKLHRTDWVVFIVGALLIAVGLFISILRRNKANPYSKSVLSRLSRLFITIGLLELLWFLFRFEAVKWFGTRFTAALVLLIGLIWLAAILKDYFKNHKKRTTEWEKEQLKLKYLQQR